MIQPLRSYVLVQPNEIERTSDEGIHLPRSARDIPNIGVVWAFGKNADSDIHIGDAVLYGKASGTEITVAGQEMLLMKDSHISMVIVDD